MAVLLRVVLVASLWCCAVSAASGASGAPAAAHDLVERAYDLYGGDDAFARLHFTFVHPDGAASRVSLVMGFRVEEGGTRRVIMFNEFPPDTRNIGFLGAFHPPDAGREDEMWLYLPELRSSRRLTPAAHDHGHHHAGATESVDEFSDSELDHEELVPRWPGLDRHVLEGRDTIDGVEAFVVASVPLDPATSAWSRRVQWITAEGVPLRIEYYRPAERRVKTQDIAWRRVDDAWVWERVVAVNHLSGARTELEQTDIRINPGLPERLFTRRALALGADAFSGRAVGR